MNKAQALSILGLSSGASDEEIKKAYRKKAMEHHPDRGGNEDKFKEAKAAFEFLEKGDQPEQNWNGPDLGSVFSHFFKDMNGERTYWQNHQVQYNANINITLTQAFTGVQNFPVQIPNVGISTTVDIQPGLKPGVILRTIQTKVNGQDAQVHLVLNIDSSPYEIIWARHLNLTGGAVDGSGNMHTLLVVSWIDIMLGGFKEVNTIDGATVSIRIPAGIETGKMLKVQGRGYWKDAQLSSRGDMLLKIIPHIPKMSDIATKDLTRFMDEAYKIMTDKNAE